MSSVKITPQKRALMHAYGCAIQELRKKRSLTQEQLAEKAERSQITISRIERGVLLPDLWVLHAIATTLGESPQRLSTHAVGVLGCAERAALALLSEPAAGGWEAAIHEVGGPKGLRALVELSASIHFKQSGAA